MTNTIRENTKLKKIKLQINNIYDIHTNYNTFSLYLLYPYGHPVLIIILFSTYISSGSLLMFNYPLILITSRFLSSSHLSSAKSSSHFAYQI